MAGDVRSVLEHSFGPRARSPTLTVPATAACLSVCLRFCMSTTMEHPRKKMEHRVGVAPYRPISWPSRPPARLLTGRHRIPLLRQCLSRLRHWLLLHLCRRRLRLRLWRRRLLLGKRHLKLLLWSLWRRRLLLRLWRCRVLLLGHRWPLLLFWRRRLALFLRRRTVLFLLRRRLLVLRLVLRGGLFGWRILTVFASRWTLSLYRERSYLPTFRRARTVLMP